MTNQSPHPNQLSPRSKHSMSAFQWPISPSSQSSTEISLKEILDRHGDNPELLKCILRAKTEEDKKKAARDTLKAEEARIQLRHMDLELAREQSKSRTAAPQPPQPQSQPPYVYGLAPVQQQVLARFNYPPQPPPQQQQQQHYRPPPSPAIPYPHSAHPLCPPSSSSDYCLPSSNNEERPPLKRHRFSISNEAEQQDKLSHNKVMEALKAKIQRGSSNNPPSPLSTSKDTKKKKLPSRPAVKVDAPNQSPSSDSPRSAKPTLPPIDTSLGRIDQPTGSEESSTGSTNTDSHKESPVLQKCSGSLTPPE
ncbi:hypothetical protein G6F46_003957 [Rhizopus delemar]|nr:hypothetical protein G6F55_008268 [Rhizopus delemar]KAG1545072.1 hypothetical protein G6F51_005681 [Rhizopus arrhizus]KAG1498718.1 hypothetical protein G6F54_004888 [Rhizopus delemar]KAG1513185.1 hypothetical protein G6F53_004623 [Rhizopus delemar]KAG1522544.1 hypothetical protein G6F52_005769 [Rhizopus delemar]